MLIIKAAHNFSITNCNENIFKIILLVISLLINQEAIMEHTMTLIIFIIITHERMGKTTVAKIWT